MAGNHKQQKIVYDQYRGYALKIVFRYIYRFDRAIDVVTDGFVKLFMHFPKFQIGDDADNEKIMMGWLKKIMINTAIDELRKDSMLPEIGGIPEYVWEISDNDNKADQRMLYKDLVGLIKELPPDYRVIFNLYVIDGYSHSEISELMQIPVGTSKSHLSRARLLLQKNIKKMEEIKLCRI
jgi:RNA polymerase sigma-70 factor (ECF subfamily)